MKENIHPTPIQRRLSITLKLRNLSPTSMQRKKQLKCEAHNSETMEQPKPTVESKKRSLPLEAFEIGNQLGRGAYGKVFHAINKETREEVAIKVYQRYHIIKQRCEHWLNNEILSLKKIKHENIIKLYQVIETRKDVNLVMELVNGQSLGDYIRSKKSRRLEEKEALRIFEQIVDGISYCHSLDIAHRDIKVDNVLLDEKTKVKLIDFGLSVSTKPQDKLKEYCGTESYMAPELTKREEYSGQAVDVWALGILLYIMVSGHYPFCGKSDTDLLGNKMAGRLKFPDTVNEDVKVLIKQMLKVDPKQRATASSILKSCKAILANKTIQSE